MKRLLSDNYQTHLMISKEGQHLFVSIRDSDFTVNTEWRISMSAISQGQVRFQR